jgi:hypothetical protein
MEPGMSIHVATPHEVDPPQPVRDLTTLGRVDYLDAFVTDVDPDDPGSPQDWARAMFEGIGRRERLEFQLVWRVLGLRLGVRPSAGRIVGWRIRDERPDHVLLHADSWIGMPAEVLVRRVGTELTIVTFVQQRTALARAMWARATPVHRAAVPGLLRRVARRGSRG